MTTFRQDVFGARMLLRLVEALSVEAAPAVRDLAVHQATDRRRALTRGRVERVCGMRAHR